jgi:octopine/nopaline transport system substrate-binding protein
MNLSKFLMAGAVAFATLAAPMAQAKDWKTVTITLEGAYAPWNLTNPTARSAVSNRSWPSISAIT